MTNPEREHSPNDTYLYDTLSGIAPGTMIIFEGDENMAVADIPMVLIRPIGIRQQTIKEVAEQHGFNRAFEEISIAFDTAAEQPHWQPNDPDSLRNFNTYIEQKDAEMGNPRELFIAAAQAIVLGRAAAAELVIEDDVKSETFPTILLTNEDNGLSTSVTLDIAGLIVTNPALLEETRYASKTLADVQSGVRKVCLNIEDLLEEQARSIDIHTNASIGTIGKDEALATDSLAVNANPLNTPLTAEWWWRDRVQVGCGQSVSVKDPAAILAIFQEQVNQHIAATCENSGTHQTTDAGPTLPIRFRSIPPFEETFLYVKQALETSNQRLAMAVDDTQVAFIAINPLPEGRGFADMDPNNNFYSMDLAKHANLRVAMENAGSFFGK